MMDEKSLNKIINFRVIPKLVDFVEEESAFFVYLEYKDETEGVFTTISPCPPEDNIEEIMREVAKKVYEETQKLPSVVVACQKVKFTEEDIADVSLMDSGILLIALEAQSAEGFAIMYSIPDMNKMASTPINKDSENAPRYIMLAISALMHETLVQAGLVEEENGDNISDGNDVDVTFSFSRN